MTTERQIRANRHNARHSTGPRSRAGKHSSAQNARKHGLYAPTPTSDIERWFRIIVADPVAMLPRMPIDDVGRAALALAEAEAFLERARSAEKDALDRLVELVAKRGKRTVLELSRMGFERGLEDDDFLDHLIERTSGDPFMQGALKIMKRANRNRPKVLRKEIDRLRAHRRRAESRRRKAISMWIKSSQAAARGSSAK